jgi:hypothetical protein
MSKLAGDCARLEDDAAVRGMGMLGEHCAEHQQTSPCKYNITIMYLTGSHDCHELHQRIGSVDHQRNLLRNVGL